MAGSSPTLRYLSAFIVPRAERLSQAAMEAKDAQDAHLGYQQIVQMSPKIEAIKQALIAFSGYEFTIRLERNYKRGRAKPGGFIGLDYAMLNKSEDEIAQTLAHEWGHQALGHIINPYWLKSLDVPAHVAENEADFYSGVFLGFKGYSLENVLKAKFLLPDNDDHHGTRLERGYFIVRGYQHGIKLCQASLAIQQSTHFLRPQLESVIPSAPVVSKLRN